MNITNQGVSGFAQMFIGHKVAVRPLPHVQVPMDIQMIPAGSRVNLFHNPRQSAEVKYWLIPLSSIGVTESQQGQTH